MKKLLLSVFALSTFSFANAQLFTADVTQGDDVNFFLAGTLSNYVLTTEDGAFTATSVGYPEYEGYFSIIIPDPIEMGADDEIRMNISATADPDSGHQPVLTVLVLDENGTGNNNQAMLDQRITIGQTAADYVVTPGDFYDTWSSGSFVDSTKIKEVRIAPNQGYTSYPYENAEGDSIKSPYKGKLTFNSIAIFQAGSPVASIDEIVGTEGLSVFPNPSNQAVNIQFDTELNGVKLYFSDVLGNVLHQEVVATGAYNGTMEFNTPGVYFVTVAAEGATVVQRVVIK